MDVLIKGLALPQKGEYDYHLTIRSDGKVEGTQQVGERIHSIHTWAIELPPHGRLIEGDELADVLVQNLEPMLTTRGVSGLQADVIREVVDAIVTMLRECPTVLEAST